MLRAKIGLVTIIIVGLLALGTGGRAQTPAERIHLFHSAIEILSDGSVLVSESLTIEALGQEIKRGILRDIPIIYRDRFNNRVSVHLEVISVTRDGREENYVLENVGDNLRIRIGRRDHLLSHGIHRYVITYRMTRMVGFFTDYDEIYWNVTGNDWSFPIDRVEARVRLPQGAALIQQDAYSGRRGTQGKDFTFGAEGADLVFRSTRSFSPGEGLTVAVAFPKGFVEEPSELEVALTYVQFNQAFGVSLIGLAGLTFYFLVVWWFIGRDPRGGAIFARYHPPRDLSPAAMRFIMRMGFDNKVFSSDMCGHSFDYPVV